MHAVAVCLTKNVKAATKVIAIDPRRMEKLVNDAIQSQCEEAWKNQKGETFFKMLNVTGGKLSDERLEELLQFFSKWYAYLAGIISVSFILIDPVHQSRICVPITDLYQFHGLLN